MKPTEPSHLERLLEVVRGSTSGDRATWLASWAEALSRLLGVSVSVYDPERGDELAAWPHASPLLWGRRPPGSSSWTLGEPGTARRHVGSLWVGLAAVEPPLPPLESAEPLVEALAEALWLEEAPPRPALLVFSKRGRQLAGPSVSSFGALAPEIRQAVHEAEESGEVCSRTMTRPGEPPMVLRASPDGPSWRVVLTPLDARSPAARELAQELLTPAQGRVARLAADGLSNQEIARVLGISAETVKAHLRAVTRKLGVSGRAKLGDWL